MSLDVQTLCDEMRNAKKWGLLADWQKRVEAAQRLGKMRADEATPELIAVVKVTEHDSLRSAGVLALGEIGSDESVRYLLTLLEDKGLVSMRPVIVQALDRTINQLTADKDVESLQRLVTLWSQVPDSLQPQIKSHLGRGNAELCVPILIDALTTNAYSIHRHIVDLLGGHASPKQIAQALSHESVRVREQIAAIAEERGKAMVPALLDLLPKADEPTRKTVIRLLRITGLPTGTNVSALLTIPDVEVHKLIIDTVASGVAEGDQEAKPILLQIVRENDNSETRLYALQTLAGLGESALPYLVDLLGNQEIDMHVVQCLAQFGSDALPHLINLIDIDDSVLAQAARRAVIGEGASAVHFLVPLLSHEDEAMRHKAYTLLPEIDESYTDILSYVEKGKPTERIPVVAPDGSGDFVSLSAAVETVEPGTVLRLQAGEHKLDEPLTVTKALTFLGDGIEDTVVSCDGAHVVRFKEEGHVKASDLSFRHIGERESFVVEVFTTQPSAFYRCRFLGAVAKEFENPPNFGVGLRIFDGCLVSSCDFSDNQVCGVLTKTLGGVGKAEIRDSVFRGNGVNGIMCYAPEGIVRGSRFYEHGEHGIMVGLGAEPLLEENICESNRISGVGYYMASGGTAIHNQCSKSQVGIAIYDDAEPILKHNSCFQNANGIAYKDVAAGTAEENDCSDNSDNGIRIYMSAEPTIRNNVCRRSEGAGISISSSSECLVMSNICEQNEVGIAVFEASQPRLQDNVCRQNASEGISFYEDAGGEARNNLCEQNKIGILILDSSEPVVTQNRCVNNGSHGIVASGETEPSLRNNTCEDNSGFGILFSAIARGVADGNTCHRNVIGIAVAQHAKPTLTANQCSNNSYHGIRVGEDATPLIENNRCLHNENCGMTFIGQAGGMARANICTNNQHGIGIGERAHPRIEANNCISNQKVGILITSQARPQLHNNRANGNGYQDVHYE